MRILTVDDEPLELDQLEWMIRQFDPLWEVIRASDGEEAIRKLDKEEVDLLLLDINMPGKNGLEVATYAKSKWANLPVVMITARTDFSSAQQALRIGVADYLGKPIIEKELLEVLKKHRKKRNQPKSILIQQVQQLIQNQYAGKLSLVGLAGNVHVHPAYLSRKFHEEMEMPLTEYINCYRLERAAELLLEHLEWTIAEISEQVGFTSQHYFSTQFRKHMSCTPRQYREEKVRHSK